MNNIQELQRLRRLCFLSFLETKHLKKLLIAHNVIPQDDLDDYANSLEEYIRDLELKDKLLIKQNQGLSDNPSNRE